MASGKQKFISKNYLNTTLVVLIIFIISTVVVFRNVFFQPTIILKSLGELSVDPKIALTNNKPTFFEFYADWCEVCKEMAPKVSALKDKYEDEINFVFLNVDNPRWESYIKKFKVNGIPQVNLFDDHANLKDTFIGRQDEYFIKELIENLNSENKQEILNKDFSTMKIKNNYQISPRSHG